MDIRGKPDMCQYAGSAGVFYRTDIQSIWHLIFIYVLRVGSRQMQHRNENGGR